MKKFSAISFITIFLFFTLDFFLGNLFLKIINRTFDETKYRVPNEFYEYGFKKNYVTKSAVWGNQYYTFCSDNRGFKFNCIEKEKKYYKYAFIGDSFTEGIGLPFEQTFVGIFKDKINNDVINLGVASYSPVIYLKKIEYFLNNGLNFEHLILAIDLTDLEDDWKRSNKKIYENNLEKKNKIILNKQNLKLFLLNNFEVTAFILRRLNWYYKINFRSDKILNHLDFEKNGASWSYIENYSLLDAKIKNLEDNVDKIFTLLKDKKIKFSILIYPHQASLLYDIDKSRYYNLWKSYCENKCEYFIDAYSGFFDEINQSSQNQVIEKYYIPLDSHLNHAGNIKVADYINQYIKE